MNFASDRSRASRSRWLDCHAPLFVVRARDWKLHIRQRVITSPSWAVRLRCATASQAGRFGRIAMRLLQPPGVSGVGRWSFGLLRAQRANPKSWRDDTRVAPHKRSAVRGNEVINMKLWRDRSGLPGGCGLCCSISPGWLMWRRPHESYRDTCRCSNAPGLRSRRFVRQTFRR